jgi:hypothetical protein
MELTKTRLQAGIWEGELTGADDLPPTLAAEHLGRPLAGLAVTPAGGDGRFLVTLPLPAELLSDGVQTVVITEEGVGEVLARISLIAGEALDDDIRAEIDLLRAELDMLKRAFRRHCVETA